MSRCCWQTLWLQLSSHLSTISMDFNWKTRRYSVSCWNWPIFCKRLVGKSLLSICRPIACLAQFLLLIISSLLFSSLAAASSNSSSSNTIIYSIMHDFCKTSPMAINGRWAQARPPTVRRYKSGPLTFIVLSYGLNHGLYGNGKRLWDYCQRKTGGKKDSNSQ